MPRTVRKKSNSGIYHVMLRGINQQRIFEDDEDYQKFLQVLLDCKAISGFELYAYCLMTNHIHLLIKEIQEPLELLMKRIEVRFVYWYNIKYRRTGHLFQDRFKSEPINDDSYFLTVLRYVHQNPIKAKLVKNIEQYQFSSYNDYFKSSDLVDCSFTFEIIPKSEFVRFNNEKNFTNCLDIDDNFSIKLTDEQAKIKIEKISKCKNASEFQALDIKLRDKYLAKFRNSGLSIRQISRLTGVSFNIVRKFN